MGCRSRVTVATGVSLLALTMVCTMLLLRLSIPDGAMAPSSSSPMESYSTNGNGNSVSGGGVPPASSTFTRLRGGWKALHTLAKKKGSDVLLSIKSSRLANRIRGNNDNMGLSMEEVAALEEQQRQEEQASAEVGAAAPLPNVQIPLPAHMIRHRADAAAAEAARIEGPASASSTPSDPSVAGAASPPSPSPSPSSTMPPPIPLAIPAAPGSDSPLFDLVVATRFWATDASGTDQAALRDFLRAAFEAGAGKVIVALNTAADRGNTKDFIAGLAIPTDRLEVLEVTPWVGVSGPLNALVLRAGQLGAQRILLQSTEVRLSLPQVRAMVHEMDAHPAQLVVGAVLDGHNFHTDSTTHASSDDEGEEISFDEDPSAHTLDGHNGPWNTAALWHVPSLLHTGFMTLADGVPSATPAPSGAAGPAGASAPAAVSAGGIHHPYGQEEVPTMALLQAIAIRANEAAALTQAQARLHHSDSGASSSSSSSAASAHRPVHRSRLTLLHVGEVSWVHSFASLSARLEWHKSKMSSKLSRARTHLDTLGDAIPPAKVIHRIARVHHEPETTVSAPAAAAPSAEPIQLAASSSLPPPSDSPAAAAEDAAASPPIMIPISVARRRSKYALTPAAQQAAAAASAAAAAVAAPAATTTVDAPAPRHSLRSRLATHAADEAMPVKIKQHIHIGH